MHSVQTNGSRVPSHVLERDNRFGHPPFPHNHDSSRDELGLVPGSNDAGPGLDLIRPPTADAWMKERYPGVFRDYGGHVFKRRGNGRIMGLGPDMLFARCLTADGSPDRPMVYCDALDNGFHRYDPISGLYRSLAKELAWLEVDELLEECAQGSDEESRVQVHDLRGKRSLSDVVDCLRGAGRVPPSYFEPRRELRHVGNGVLDLTSLRLRPFSPELRSLSKIAVDWDPDAKRPRRFVGWLRRMFPCPADRDLALSVMALALLGNPLQRLVILCGPGGTGKSTWVKLLASLLGPGASGQLRLDHIGNRFEAQRWVGKLLLHADEASGELSVQAAEELKRLSGQDPHEAEMKNSNEAVPFTPTALPILVANGRISVPLNGDIDAWRRRLVVLTVAASTPDEADNDDDDDNNVIPEFEKVLVDEEGPGILRLVAARAREMLGALDRQESFSLLTGEQKSQVELLLGSLDPLRAFVKECVRPAEGAHLYGGEARDAARAWLESRGYEVPPNRSLARKLKGHVERAGGLNGNSLPEHPVHSSRGWRHVVLKCGPAE